MKIVAPKDALEQLMSSRRSIILTYTKKANAEKFLNQQDITITSKPQWDDIARTVTIHPQEVIRKIQYDALPSEFTKGLKGYKSREIYISDFNNSDAFYSDLAKDKPGIKILDDAFSARRGATIFEFIAEVEKDLRRQFRHFYTFEETTKAKYHRKDQPDDIMNFYSFSEMIYEQLLAPASDKYYLGLLSKSEDDDDKIYARTASKLEELGIPLTPEELKDFANTRNAVTHFRVVTYKDCETLLGLSEKYQCHGAQKLLKDIADSAVKGE